MEYILAKNNEEDFQGFLKLSEEWDRRYVILCVGEQYVRVPFTEQTETDKKKEFAEQLEKEDFFLFAKEGDKYAGYLFGECKDTSYSYKIRNVGYLDSLIVAEKYRGQGVASKMKELFFEWLRSKNVTICQIHVNAKNPEALEVYKKWGFEVDELRLWKKI
jgi:ribosomal protein S18 acetylase RimI-like enzyme